MADALIIDINTLAITSLIKENKNIKRLIIRNVWFYHSLTIVFFEEKTAV